MCAAVMPARGKIYAVRSFRLGLVLPTASGRTHTLTRPALLPVSTLVGRKPIAVKISPSRTLVCRTNETSVSLFHRHRR